MARKEEPRFVSGRRLNFIASALITCSVLGVCAPAAVDGLIWGNSARPERGSGWQNPHGLPLLPLASDRGSAQPAIRGC